MNTPPILEVKDLSVQLSGKQLLRNVNFTLHAGENLAIIGASGSGKTTLIRAIAAKCFAAGTVVAIIGQQHRFRNLSNLSSFYYQQRFNSADSMDARTVKEELLAEGAPENEIEEKLALLGIGHLADTRLIQLSNGEHKRFQLAKALLKQPQWLLLDSPYTGLDVKARAMLNDIIDAIAAEGIHVLLVTSYSDIPSAITHVTLLENGQLQPVQKKDEFSFPSRNDMRHEALSFDTAKTAYPYADFNVAVKMVSATVQYDNRKILDNINWEVKKGECWNVSGHNGSGKSTLLSLVNGDNPQAFANEIYLFDRKKGSGESIWDIKQKIGYVSPELHHYFDPAISCFQVVASGLFDTIGLFRQLNAEQKQITTHWMELLRINSYSNRLFNRLSNGEQRLVLLARALVKNPPLLILDEPCQGLDAEVSARFISLINDICVQLKKTLIYVSHYEAEIPSCVTKTLKLEHGRIAA